jgi:hypothetical protein
MGFSFLESEVPDNQSLFEFVQKNSDFNRQIARFRRFDTSFVALESRGVAQQLRESTLKLCKELRPQAFKNNKNSVPYEGITLSFDPKSWDRAGFAEEIDISGSLYFDDKTVISAERPRQKNLLIRHSYFDAWATNRLTKPFRNRELGHFLRGCKRTLVASRIGILKANQPESLKPHFGWHRDADLFCFTKVIIPIQSHQNYFIEVNFPTKERFTLEEDKIYLFDSSKYHRTAGSHFKRARIVYALGFVPWFDYNSAEEAWISNEFYGQAHPYEIAAIGEFHPQISL